MQYPPTESVGVKLKTSCSGLAFFIIFIAVKLRPSLLLSVPERKLEGRSAQDCGVIPLNTRSALQNNVKARPVDVQGLFSCALDHAVSVSFL